MYTPIIRLKREHRQTFIVCDFLKYNTVPFIRVDELKLFYYCGQKEWLNERRYFRATCLTAQDKFKNTLITSRFSTYLNNWMFNVTKLIEK